MLNTKQLSELYPVLWEVMHDLFNSKINQFPCLYAISSFNKEAMHFGVSTPNSSVEILARDLKDMSLLLDNVRDEKAKTLSTYIHIFQGHKIENVGDFLINLLRDLHHIDEEKWLDNAPNDMNDVNFKFCFNRHLWLPILLSPIHPSSIRSCSYTLIAFQPNVTFDYNKQERPEYYQRMRTSTHQRIDNYYLDGKPYYLSEQSSGGNIVQFIGTDLSEHDCTYRYPTIDVEHL